MESSRRIKIAYKETLTVNIIRRWQRTYGLKESIQRSDKRRIIVKAKMKQDKDKDLLLDTVKNQTKEKKKGLYQADRGKETSSKDSLSEIKDYL